MNGITRISPRKLAIALACAIAAVVLLATVGLAKGFPFQRQAQTNTVPPVLNYQGVLSDPSNDDLLDGTFSMTFKLYDSPDGMTPLWEETQQVTSNNGLFNVYLGEANPLDTSLFVAQELYLGVTVEEDAEMAPRLRLASSPFSFTSAQTYCAMATFYLDGDNDTYGNPAISLLACTKPDGYADNNLDCNDTSGAIHPGASELCNGFDDNCNNVADEGDPEGGAGCDTGLPGACSIGTRHCTSGALQCVQNVQPSSEVCDGLDNDCNGMADDGIPGMGSACDTGLPGVCSSGTLTCDGGATTCMQNFIPSPDEICGDGLDNDCNGLVDDGCL